MSAASEQPVTRVHHSACIHPDTYKYFFPRARVREVWARLQSRYGPISARPGLGVMEIQHRKLILRATTGGNPITVIRTRRCAPADIEELHELIGYRGEKVDPSKGGNVEF